VLKKWESFVTETTKAYQTEVPISDISGDHTTSNCMNAQK